MDRVGLLFEPTPEQILGSSPYLYLKWQRRLLKENCQIKKLL